MLTVNIFTIFPTIFDSVFSQTIIKRAQNKNLLKINIYDLRKWTSDRHQTVDDTPYGGGAGLVMKVDPFYKAFQELNIKRNSIDKKIFMLSPRGKILSQNLARQLSSLEEITLICGRYEGVDQRVIDHLCDGELSIGDYVLSGGEIAAITVVDVVTRLIPGVLGNNESSLDESFTNENELEYPQYTKPAEYITNSGEKWVVPEVLLSGNHEKIRQWRNANKKIKKNK